MGPGVERCGDGGVCASRGGHAARNQGGEGVGGGGIAGAYQRGEGGGGREVV